MTAETTSSTPPGYQALVTGLGIFKGPPRARLSATGADCRRFLNGMVTCDVRELQEAHGAYGFFTSRQGKILADVAVFAGLDGLTLDLPAVRAEAILEHLLTYRVADRVELETGEAESEVQVAGAGARGILADLVDGPPPDGVWTWRQLGELSCYCERVIGAPAWRFRGPSAAVEALRQGVLDVGGTEARTADVDSLRVERGAPWFGVDFDEECLPQETGLEGEAVSYSKGCYLGQEVVARIHHRGHVNRHIRGLVAVGGADLAAGEELLLEDDRVGVVTTTSFSPALGSPAALALVHRKAPPGVTVQTAAGEAATVFELPLAGSQGAS